MAEELLGVGFEIHGGGNDLVFPHHENEAAQTRAARGAELARIWMHNGMLQMGDEKMAKSVGNVALLHEVARALGPRRRRVFFATGHYRQPLAVHRRDAGGGRGDACARMREAGPPARRRARRPSDAGRLRERFFAALADDFNTPEALAGAGRVGARGQQSPDGRRAATTCARCSASSGSRTCSTPTTGAPAGRRRAGAPQRAAARAARDFAAGRPPARRDRAPRAGPSATSPTASSSCRA